MTLHRASRAKVLAYFKTRGIENGVILIKGGEEQNQYDTDIELVFRQDSWFNYLFGVMEPGTTLIQFIVCDDATKVTACLLSYQVSGALCRSELARPLC